MAKQKKKIAEAPDGTEWIWVRDPLLSRPDEYGETGLVRPNRAGAKHYQFGELRLVRTEKVHTHEGRRCIFVDMPVFEVE